MRFRLALGFSFPCAKGANVADTVDKMCWFQGKSTEKHGFHQIYRFEPKKKTGFILGAWSHLSPKRIHKVLVNNNLQLLKHGMETAVRNDTAYQLLSCL
jgi:hypothetical protein